MQVKRQVDIPAVHLPALQRQHHRHIKVDSDRRQNLTPILNLPAKDSLLPIGVDPAVPLVGLPKLAIPSSLPLDATSSILPSTIVVAVAPSAVVVTAADNSLSTSTTWVVATAAPQVASVTGGASHVVQGSIGTLLVAMAITALANL